MGTIPREPLTPNLGAVVVPAGTSAAAASTPDVGVEDGRYHIYESNPVPWWIAVLWLGFFAFAFVYLITNLLN